ncbi:hypothetical protein SDRG_11749 [Saprolegnia diclina VS20]|uniref:Amino acid permease/ SLC12A domain-containing protein n=1 Tax=Saprolegnia diclina (strain VS20) TaxID=1156394 RepID=T0Q7T9_SAPDV|nr:hypothetical protein SDRG_11749 [Saprolegnia diclina VS20]EQC30696.1 hypothetical protein SDRG_11749 [Saprolegnia diclina VS20]|eukprot:XP_008616022.1 hypothetical protein SDRG_11749 [Saprolegnia diclina VS20]
MTSPSSVTPTPSTSAKTTLDCRVDATAAIEVDVADKASMCHIWALGVLTVIGGQFYGWNEALSTGFVPYFVSQVLMGLAFIAYMACASEVCGKIQFSGGAYGLARVTLGFYTGFLVGFLELLEYVTYTSVSVLFMSDFMTTTYGVEKAWEPLLWAIYYAVTTSLILLRGKHFWRFCLVLAAACVVPPLVYCVASIGHTDFATYGPLQIGNASEQEVWAAGDLGAAYFAWLPYTTWAYAGVECLTLVTSVTKDAKTSMPKGLMAATYTLFVFNVALVCIVSALPPGLAATASAQFPLNTGFELGLHMSAHGASWLIMPGQFGMAFGFMMPCARLAQALADSNLLPLRLGIKGQSTPRRALVLTSTSGYLICLVSFYSPLFLSALSGNQSLMLHPASNRRWPADTSAVLPPLAKGLSGTWREVAN